MSDLAPFRRLFAYDAWASHRIAEAVGELPAEEARAAAVRLFAHLIASQHVWLRRLRGRSLDGLAIWPDDTLADAREAAERAQQGWAGYLSALAPEALDAPVTYQNSKGMVFQSTPREVMTHVVNHGTHHRGQIMLLLRQAGATPPPADYIVFCRLAQPAA